MEKEMKTKKDFRFCIRLTIATIFFIPFFVFFYTVGYLGLGYIIIMYLFGLIINIFDYVSYGKPEDKENLKYTAKEFLEVLTIPFWITRDYIKGEKE